jgi:hypothetical protein
LHAHLVVQRFRSDHPVDLQELAGAALRLALAFDRRRILIDQARQRRALKRTDGSEEPAPG